MKGAYLTVNIGFGEAWMCGNESRWIIQRQQPHTALKEDNLKRHQPRLLNTAFRPGIAFGTGEIPRRIHH